MWPRRNGSAEWQKGFGDVLLLAMVRSVPPPTVFLQFRGNPDGFIATAAILVLQVFYYRTSPVDQFRANTLATSIPYIGLIALYVVVQFFRAPLLLNRRHAARIKESESQRPSPVFVEFDKLQFQQFQQGQHPRNNRVLLVLRLRAGDTPITLHDWRLRSSLKPTLSPTLASVDFEHVRPLQRSRSQSVRLEEHDGKKWLFSF